MKTIRGLDGTKRPAPESWALLDLVMEKPPKGFSFGLIDIVGMDPRPTDPDEGAVSAILSALEGVGAKPVTIVAVAPDRLQVTCHIPREVPRAAAHRDPLARRMLFDAYVAVRRALGRGGRMQRRKQLIQTGGVHYDRQGNEVLAQVWWTHAYGFTPCGCYHPADA